MTLDRRQRTYVGVRAGAGVGFVLSATVLPAGLPAVLLGVSCGIAAVLAGIGVNAGGPGEQAAARAQQRAYEQIRPPQGAWPPYEERRVVEGELAD